MNTLLLWDNSNTGQICHHLRISFPDDVCDSLEALKSNKLLHSKDAVIVLLETDIDNHKRADFYGLEIIKCLRKELRYAGLIIAYSFCDEKYFRSIKNTEILFTSGTWLKALPKIDFDEIEQQIEGFPKLSNELLDDIAFSAFDNRGKIHEYLHNLKNELNVNNTKESLANITKQQNTVFERYRNLLVKEIDPQKITAFHHLFDTLIEETAADLKEHWDKNTGDFSYTNAGSQVSKYSNQIAELVPVSNDDEAILPEEKINWEVLFFDDNQKVREIVAHYFTLKNVTCHTAATGKEVDKILKENSPNISLFISDIRLLDKNEHWCDRQGYDVIEEVNKTNDYPLVYSVLTSKKGTINKMVQKKRKYEILWFTKEDVINNIHSFNIFFDMVKGYADENFNSNTVFQPLKKDSYWYLEYENRYAFPLRAYYKLHKESLDYHTLESLINQKTLEFIEGEHTKQQWTCRLDKKYIDSKELKKFREAKLLGRRISLAFAAEGTYNRPETVYNLMTGQQRNSIDSSVKGLYAHFALSSQLEKTINDVKNYFKGETESPGVLYEEYEFLKNEFIEELFIDSINLGYEKEGLEEFVRQIEKTFTKNNISKPKSFVKVESILFNNGFPRAERLDNMFAELNELNEQSSYKLLKDVGTHSFLSSVNNEVIKELLKKYEFI